MNAKVRWLILQLGMCIAPKCLDECEAKTGIAPFNRLLTQIMNQAPYKDAKRVFQVIIGRTCLCPIRGRDCIQKVQKWLGPNIVPLNLMSCQRWLRTMD